MHPERHKLFTHVKRGHTLMSRCMRPWLCK